ncbi:MAG: TetR/AcrR family transcriptional regulator [Pseudomonadota bacterium]
MQDLSPDPKRGRKVDQVIDGARTVFMREGFEGASVDAIARAAGVSKATLYSYFSDKKQLFLAVAKMECLRQSEAAMELAKSGQSARETMTDIAQRMTAFFFSDLGKNVFRICMAESDRFPEIGRTFYQSGPEMARNRVVEYLEGAVEAGELNIEDCNLAADQFAELCKAEIWPRLMFNVIDEVHQDDIDRIIAAAVDMFMARYGPSQTITT